MRIAVLLLALLLAIVPEGVPADCSCSWQGLDVVGEVVFDGEDDAFTRTPQREGPGPRVEAVELQPLPCTLSYGAEIPHPVKPCIERRWLSLRRLRL